MTNKKPKNHKKTHKEDTDLVHWGRDPAAYFGIVNPPVVKTSSIIYNNMAQYFEPGYRYARNGTPLSQSLEDAITQLQGGFGAITASSGLGAITTALLSFLKAGDHLLMTDAVYPPVRTFCNDVLTRMGVDVEYYDPRMGAQIEKLFRPETTVLYMESPGTGIFDVMDVQAFTKATRKHKIVTLFDDSWSGGVVFKPFKHGVDVVVQSLTKYIGGHSDIMLGAAIAANEKLYKALRKSADDMGVCGGSDELFLALRGLRTIKIRMRQHHENALTVARWLDKHPAIKRVYYPALPSHETHALWKRDYTGANGLLSILLKPATQKSLYDCVDSLTLFPVANSWGGYESLLQPQKMNDRAIMKWSEKGALLRLHIGLEDPDDLIKDLEQGLKKLK
jgi:cystathionine beta-lyase